MNQPGLKAPQEGEVALTLTLLSLIVILAGTVIGTQHVVRDTVQKYLSHGQTSCSYHTVTSVYKDRVGGELLNKSEMNGVWGVSNDQQNQSIPVGRFDTDSRFDYSTQNLVFKPNGGLYEQDGKADVTVFGPVEPGSSSGDWEITGTFCNQAPGSLVPCPNVSSQQTSKTIKGFSVSCGANIEYGWVVKRITHKPANKYNTFALNVWNSDLFKSPGDNHLCWSVGNNQGNNNIKSQSFADYACQGQVNRKADGSVSTLSVCYQNKTGKIIVKKMGWQVHRCKDNAVNCVQENTSSDGDRVEEGGDLKTLENNKWYNCTWDVSHLKNPYTILEDGCQVNADSCSFGSNPQPQPTSSPQPTIGSERSESVCSPDNMNKQGICDPACCRVGSQCPGGQTCSILNGNCNSGKSCCSTTKINKQNQCDAACCGGDNECPNGQKCNISNGNCNSGHSCNPTNQPQPTTPPVGPTAGPSCSRQTCVYSQQESDGSVGCHVGNCRSGENCRMDTLDNSTCTFVAGCSTGRKVSCPEGPTSILPTTMVPTVMLPTQAPVADDCKVIPGGPIGIVFIPQGYTDINKFLFDVGTGIDNLIATNLGAERISRMNFKVYNKLDIDYQGKRVSLDTLPDAIKADLILSKCGGKNPVIVNYAGGYTANIAQLGPNHIIKLTPVSLSTGQAFAHELGHAHWLIHEFTDPASHGDGPEPNCDTSSSCSNLASKHKGKIVCTLGCVEPNWYRSSDKSIMQPVQYLGTYDHAEKKDFNDVDLDVWDQNDSQLAGFAALSDNTPYHNTIKVLVDQKGVGNLSLKEVSAEQSYPIDYPAEVPYTSKGDYYIVNILDNSGKVVYMAQIAHTDHPHTHTFNMQTLTETTEDGGTQVKDQLLLYLPYFENAKSIVFRTPDGKDLLNIDVSAQELTPPAKNQNLCGNGICDARNGEDVNSCRVDCQIVDDARKKVQTMDINGDKVVNAIDFGQCIVGYGKTGNDLRCDIDKNQKTDALDLSIIIENLGRSVN